ncbi:MAG: hypothetical protein ACJA2B_001071 [Candidatus Endobugula sp.]|jgi:hypothetical protein
MGNSKNALFPRLLRRLRARILIYDSYTVVLRAVASGIEATTVGALTKKILFLEVTLYKNETLLKHNSLIK